MFLVFKAVNLRTGEEVIFDDLYWFEENSVHYSVDNDWKVNQYTGYSKDGKKLFVGDKIKASISDLNGFVSEYEGVVEFSEFELTIKSNDNFWPVISFKCINSWEFA